MAIVRICTALNCKREATFGCLHEVTIKGFANVQIYIQEGQIVSLLKISIPQLRSFHVVLATVTSKPQVLRKVT